MILSGGFEVCSSIFVQVLLNLAEVAVVEPNVREGGWSQKGQKGGIETSACSAVMFIVGSALIVSMARIQTAEITFENVAICCSSKRASLE